jgi:hypothetical protein
LPACARPVAIIVADATSKNLVRMAVSIPVKK